MTAASPLPLRRRPETFVSDDRRVITRYLNFGNPHRVRSILSRLVQLTDEQVEGALAQTLHDFSPRHRDIRATFLDYFREISSYLPLGADLSEKRRLLYGAYFTLEYSIESAALFNPSIVPHPEQGNLPNGSQRFLMSMRATGEGHVSSIVLHRGVIDESGEIRFDPPPRYAYSARPIDKPQHRDWFETRLNKMGVPFAQAQPVVEALPEIFTYRQLLEVIERVRSELEPPHGFVDASGVMLWLMQANYDLHFPEDCSPREVVIFPATENEARGMEDLRLVRFVEDDGREHFYGTYTAFDGRQTLPMMLETDDFLHFRIRTLTGRYIRNKGLAMFPRRIDGHYFMVSRHDGENMFLLQSEDPYTWNQSRPLEQPKELWELVQIGNAGSPIETDAGWLLITHGVGPVRRYCLGAILLDLHEPWRVIGRLRDPLLEPTAAEREGYVPNVVYSCGSLVHHGDLLIPYAVSDVATRFATVPLDALLERLLSDGP